MKTSSLAVFVSLIVGLVVLPAVSIGADTPSPDKIFTAPVMPGGKIAEEEGGRVSVLYDLPYDKVNAWYVKIMEQYPDEKFREWKEQTYIEDQGGAPWHSIGISKEGGNQTTVTYVRDNWTWILSTLLIRFVGVFVVLMVLWMMLSIATRVMGLFIKEEGAKAK